MRRRFALAGLAALGVVALLVVSLPPLTAAIAPPGEPVAEDRLLNQHRAITDNATTYGFTITTSPADGPITTSLSFRTNSSHVYVASGRPNATLTSYYDGTHRYVRAEDNSRTHYFTARSDEFVTEGLRRSAAPIQRYDWRATARADGGRTLTPARPGYGLANPLTARSQARVTADGFISFARLDYGPFNQAGGSTFTYHATRNPTVTSPPWLSTAREQAPRFTNITRTDGYVAVTVRNSPVPAGTSFHTTRLTEPASPGTRLYITNTGVLRTEPTDSRAPSQTIDITYSTGARSTQVGRINVTGCDADADADAAPAPGPTSTLPTDTAPSSLRLSSPRCLPALSQPHQPVEPPAHP